MDKPDGGQSKRERDERSQVLIDQLSVAVRNAKDELQEQAEERGLFVLTQVGCMGEQQAKLATSREHESAKLHAPKRPRVL